MLSRRSAPPAALILFSFALGGLHTLCFAPNPYGGWFQMPVLAAFFALVSRARSVRAAALTAGAFGFAHFVSGVFWFTSACTPTAVWRCRSRSPRCACSPCIWRFTLRLRQRSGAHARRKKRPRGLGGKAVYYSPASGRWLNGCAARESWVFLG